METKSLGYKRKSPDEHESTESSMNNQEEMIINTCAELNWNLVKIFFDKNITGSDRNRKGFLELIQSAKELKKSNPDVVIVVKDQDRFCRDPPFFQDTLMDLDAYGIKVFSIMRHKFLSHEDLGDVVTSVVDGQTIITGRRNAFKLLEDKKLNSMPSIPAPFGYKYSKSSKNHKNWIVDTSKAQIVRIVVNDYLNKVRFKITLENLKINKCLYYRIINNAKKGLYSGFITYTRKFRDSKKQVIRKEEISYKGTYELIVSIEDFKKINPNFYNETN